MALRKCTLDIDNYSERGPFGHQLNYHQVLK